MTAPTTEPNVVSLSLTDRSGVPVRLTVGTDVVDVMQPARTFGRADLADPDAHGRFQRRVVALPDVRDDVVTPMLLTIATNEDLYLVRRTPGDGADWAAVDLGAAFGAGANIRALGAAATADDRITVAVAVDEGALTRLFVAYDLSSAHTDWSQVPWIDCGTRAGVRVEGIRVLDGGDRTWTVVCTGNDGPNGAVYLLRGDGPTRRLATALVFSPGVTFQEILDFEAGVHPTFGAGLYVLGTSGRTRVLQFRPFPELDRSGRISTPSIVDLPCPARANVLEAGPTGQDGTDLYVGGNGVGLITAVEQDEQEDATVVTVAGADGLTDVVDVALSPAPDGAPVVWALRANGDLNVVTPRGDGGWGNRLLLRTGVQEIAPVARDEHQSASLVAVRGTGAAVQLWRDAGTGAWHEAAIPVDDPRELAVHTCYGTTVRVLDDVGMPRTDIRVTVSASELTSVSLNGATTYLGPGLTTEATPDANGGITLYDRVKSLTPATYRFTVDVLPDAVDVNPAAGVHERFRHITADDLRTAQVTALDGTRTPLLDEQGRAGPVDAVAEALNQGARVAAVSVGTLPGVRLAGEEGISSTVRADTLPAGYAWGVRTRGGTVETMDSGAVAAVPAAASATVSPSGLGETIADFFEGVVAGARKVATFVLRKIGDAVEFVCEIAGVVRTWVLETLEELGAFFTWLWNEIKVGLEKLWQWLKFVVDWKDILRVRTVLVDVTSQQLTHLEGEIRESKPTVNAGFDLLTGRLDTWRAAAGLPPKRLPPPAPGTSGTDTLRTARTADKQAAVDKAGGNPVVGWVSSQLASLMENVVTVEGPSPLDRLARGAGDFLDGLAGDQLANLERCVDTIRTDLAALFGGKVPSLDELSFDTIRTALVSVGTEAVRGLIDGLRAVVLRLIDLAADVIAALRDALFQTVRFPIIEKLVALVSPGTAVDTSVRLIDGIMLLVAVPTTITYKLIAGPGALPAGKLPARPPGRTTVQAEDVLATSGLGLGLDDATWETVSRVVHIAVPFLKLGVTYYDALNAPYEEVELVPPSRFWQLVGFLPSVLGLVAEGSGIRWHRGTEVAVTESFATTITLAQVTKSFVLMSRIGHTAWPYGRIVKADATLNLALTGAHLACRSGVYSTIIAANYAKRAASSNDDEITRLWQDDALQSVLYVEQILDHASLLLGNTAKVTSAPHVRLGCSIAAAVTRLATVGVAAIAVITADGTDQPISR